MDALLSTEPALSATATLPNLTGRDLAGVRETAQRFEAVFLSQMLKPMMADATVSEPFGGGFGESMWTDVLAEEIAGAVCTGGGIGLADAVVDEVLRAQEAAANTPPPAPATEG